MRYKVYLAVILLSLVTSGATQSANQSDGVFAIKTKTGYLVVWNKEDNHFTLDITGKEVKPQTNTPHMFFNVDGIVLQVQSVPIKAFLKDDKSKRGAEAILKAHMEWEAEYISNALKQNLNIGTSTPKLINGNEALLWEYEMPEGVSENVKKQYYLSLLSGKNVVLLNGLVTTPTNEAAVEQLLLSTAASLKTSSRKIDVKKLQEAIRREAAS